MASELPLVLAIRSEGADCVEALLAADGIGTHIASSSFCDRTPLAAAASLGTADLVRRFLAVDGVAVNRPDTRTIGYTALMEASTRDPPPLDLPHLRGWDPKQGTAGPGWDCRPGALH